MDLSKFGIGSPEPPCVYSQTNALNLKPYKYQVDAIKFAESNNFRCGIFDEQGLGKTIQAVLPIKYNEHLKPYLILCQTSLQLQFQEEIAMWCGIENVPYIVGSSKHLPPAISNGFIISHDMVARLPEDWKASLGIKYAVIDECQAIKNPDSNRTKAVCDWVSKIPHFVATSGTPIKNRPSEFFTILNLLSPNDFPSRQAFYARYINIERGKEYGLNPYWRKDFENRTKRFCIRRMRQEIFPELPTINRQFRTVDLDARSRELYEVAMKQAKSLYNLYQSQQKGLAKARARQNVLAELQRLRHIVGITKILPAVEYVKEFLDSTDSKIAVFTEHNDVTEQIKNLLEADGIPVLTILGGMQAAARERAKKLFNEDSVHRVILVKTLAGGVGLNLQHQCYTALMVERQWNPANENQAETRFTRPNSPRMNGQVDAIYLVSVASIDKKMAHLIEKKRLLLKEAVDHHEITEHDHDLMEDLMDEIFGG